MRRLTPIPTELARNPNLAKVYRATYIPCPRCDQPIRKVACNSGSFFVTCENLVAIQPGQRADRRSPRCGQQMYVVAIEGIAVAVPISKEEFKAWLRTYPTALEVFAKLGVVVATGPETVAAIPEWPCKACGAARPIHELFGGECRRCAGLDQREA